MLPVSMNAMRGHYIPGYAILGATGPYLPQFFRSARGLDDQSIGWVLAVSQLPVFFSPILLTYLADRHVSPRLLAFATCGLSMLALAALAAWESLGGVMLASAAYSFSVAALLPSMDGLCFAWSRRRQGEGLTTPPYHHFRMLGTVGYVIPAIVLLFLLHEGADLTWVIYTSLAFALLAACNTLRLPEARGPDRLKPAGKHPWLDALRVLFSRRWIWLSASFALLQVGSSCYYAVFPVHLTHNLGLSPRWLGLISSLGVAVEVPLIFGLGWLTARFGLRRVVIFGAVASMLRLGVLTLAPDATTAIATQLLHGMVVVGTLIAPVVFVNQLAGDSFRNSMQGVLAVAVTGPCKFLAPLVNGWLAQHDARWAFAFGSGLAGVAALLVWRLVPDAPEQTS